MKIITVDISKKMGLGWPKLQHIYICIFFIVYKKSIKQSMEVYNMCPYRIISSWCY